MRIQSRDDYALGPGEYLRPLQLELAPWLVRSLGCRQ